ncbi:MAG: ice-binding family protein [bacterium]|nr:ice-binding family protein [bacterium]
MKRFNKNVILTISSVLWVFGLISPIMAFAAGPIPVDLSSAGNFVILSKTGITDANLSVITGNVGSSPISGTATLVTCAEVTGIIYSVNAAGPLPCRVTDSSLLTAAVGHMEAAYTNAVGRSALAGDTDLYAGNLGGQTFAPGLYKWTTDVTIPTDVTLSGGANDVWIFQMTGNLNIASGPDVPSGIKVLLSGGALASNIFWQVGGGTGATLGTYSTFNGNILSAKQIIMQSGAVLNGRALTQTQVTLDANTVSVPTGSVPAILHVIKQVVNNSTGTGTAPLFNLHVKLSGVDVAGSPSSGTVSPGTSYSLSAGTYNVSEDINSSYTQSFSGDCDSNGDITLSLGTDKTCTIINTDIPTPEPEPTPTPEPTPEPVSGSGGSRRNQSASIVTPIVTPINTNQDVVTVMVADISFSTTTKVFISDVAGIPNLPDTGFAPRSIDTFRVTFTSIFILILVLTSLVLITKKHVSLDN